MPSADTWQADSAGKIAPAVPKDGKNHPWPYSPLAGLCRPNDPQNLRFCPCGPDGPETHAQMLGLQ